MNHFDPPALPAGAQGASPDHALPPGDGTGPLQKGRRTIANALDRAGQEGGAEYMRSLDIENLDRHLQTTVRSAESGVRARPLLSVLAAVAAGFLVGRILRD